MRSIASNRSEVETVGARLGGHQDRIAAAVHCKSDKGTPHNAASMDGRYQPLPAGRVAYPMDARHSERPSAAPAVVHNLLASAITDKGRWPPRASPT